jgi:hypothetical protein
MIMLLKSLKRLKSSLIHNAWTKYLISKHLKSKKKVVTHTWGNVSYPSTNFLEVVKALNFFRDSSVFLHQNKFLQDNNFLT